MERLLGRWDSTHRSTRMRGWDFSVLEGALVCGEPDWDFEAECRGALVALADAGGGTVLDMGTGGGERLALPRRRRTTGHELPRSARCP